MRRYVARFGEEARAAYKQQGFRNQADAARKAGLDTSVVSRLLNGVPPGAGSLILWARAINQPLAKWLALAQDEDWQDTTASSSNPPSGPVQRAEGENGSEHGEGGQNASPAAGAAKSGALVQFTHPDPPREVYDAIAMAETNEDKIQIAWDYIRRPELKLRFGAHRADRADIRLDIIRHYEEITGIRLLPPEVY